MSCNVKINTLPLNQFYVLDKIAPNWVDLKLIANFEMIGLIL